MLRLLIGAVLSLSASLGLAQEAQVLQVTKSVDINAPAADVWNRVKDYNALNSWHPAVAKDEIVEGKNNEVGAVRLLTLGDGGQLREKLLGYDAAGMSFKYSILEGVLPVSGYESTLNVEMVSDATSMVTWSGSFRRKDTGPAPAAGADDAAATSTIESVYQGGLDNLKKLAETK